MNRYCDIDGLCINGCICGFSRKIIWLNVCQTNNEPKSHWCYDIKPVRKEEGKSYWKIPLCDDDATREK